MPAQRISFELETHTLLVSSMLVRRVSSCDRALAGDDDARSMPPALPSEGTIRPLSALSETTAVPESGNPGAKFASVPPFRACWETGVNSLSSADPRLADRGDK